MMMLMKLFRLVFILLLIHFSLPAQAETKKAASETSASTSNLEVIRSLSETIQSLSETIRVLSESARSSAKTETLPLASDKKGLTFQGEFDEDFMPLRLDFNLPKFKTGKMGYQIDVQDMAFHFQADSHNPHHLALSNGYFKVGYFNFNLSLLGLKTTLDKLDVTSSSQLQGNSVHYSLHTQLGRLFVPKAILGEKDLDLSFESQVDIRNLEATALLALQNIGRELGRQVQGGATSDEEIETRLTTKLKEVMPLLLANSPEINIPTWKLSTPAGEFQGNASVKVDGSQSGSIKFDDESELGNGLLEVLQVQAEVSIGKELLNEMLLLEMEDEEEVAAQVHAWVEQKFLVEADENSYSAVISLQDGKLIINGMVEDLRQPSLEDEVKQAVDLLLGLQIPAAEYYAAKGTFPTLAEIEGKTSDEYVASVVSNPEQFYFQATLKEELEGVEPEIAGKTLRLTFDHEGNSWVCGPGEPDGIDRQYLPENCQ